MSSTMVAEPEMRAPRVEAPALRARARVERVEAVVVGADEDRLVDDRGPGVDVAAGLLAPRDLARRGHERVHAPVGRADVDAPVRDRRRGVEVALAESAVAAEPGRPPAPRARPGVEAVDVAVVGADDEQAAAVGGRALDRAADMDAPAAVAGAGVERRQRAVLGAEVERGADEQGGGLRAGADAVAPHALAVRAAQRDARRRPARTRRRGASSSAGLVASGAGTWRVQRLSPVLGLNEMTRP